MNQLIENLIVQIMATSLLEWVAVCCALAYLILAVFENIWCWLFAFISTAIYTVLFFDVNLYMESALNVYYLIMAVYGWYQWKYNTLGKFQKPIVQWSIIRHLFIILATGSLVWLSSILLEKYTNQDFALLDSFTTYFAVITTYMVAQKVLENWYYWMIINSVSIYLMIQKDFTLTALLLCVYLIISVFGWIQWYLHYKKQTGLKATHKTFDKSDPLEPQHESA